jgi:hypothetical protein
MKWNGIPSDSDEWGIPDALVESFIWCLRMQIDSTGENIRALLRADDVVDEVNEENDAGFPENDEEDDLYR